MPKRQENLMPIEQVNSRRTQEEHKKDSRKGGIKSGEARRRKKEFKELFNMLLDAEIKDEKAKKILNKLGIEDEDKTNKMLLVATTFQKAVQGDMRAFENIRDTAGEKPKENDTNEDVMKKLDKLLESQSAKME